MRGNGLSTVKVGGSLVSANAGVGVVDKNLMAQTGYQYNAGSLASGDYEEAGSIGASGISSSQHDKSSLLGGAFQNSNGANSSLSSQGLSDSNYSSESVLGMGLKESQSSSVGAGGVKEGFSEGITCCGTTCFGGACSCQNICCCQCGLDFCCGSCQCSDQSCCSAIGDCLKAVICCIPNVMKTLCGSAEKVGDACLNLFKCCGNEISKKL